MKIFLEKEEIIMQSIIFLMVIFVDISFAGDKKDDDSLILSLTFAFSLYVQYDVMLEIHVS